MVSTMIGILASVANSIRLLESMTGEVAVAQRAAANLANSQREVLRLLQAVTELAGADAPTDGQRDAVELRHGLFDRQFDISHTLLARRSSERWEAEDIEAKGIKAQMATLDWAAVRSPVLDRIRLGALTAGIAAVEKRVKILYDGQTRLFYTATKNTLRAKEQGELALGGLVALVAVLGCGWVVTIRKRSRTDLRAAYEALVKEMSDRRSLQDQLTYQAFHDALTALPNRARLVGQLDQALAAATPAHRVAVLLIDLDGFKGVNDTLGHHAGDELLRQIATRLQQNVRGTDTAARLGGDEFAVILNGGLPANLTDVTDRILGAIREPLTILGRTVQVGASIGVAVAGPETSPDDLIRDADTAMYAAKAAGKNRVETFKPFMRDYAAERSSVERELTRAVDLGQIEVSYQPIVDLTDGRILALEALARWRHPERGLIPPTVFIPVAEESGLIIDLGRHILLEACAAASRWRRLPGHGDLGITVNVSGRQVLSGDLAAHVVRALEAAGLDPSALTLEITESVLLDDTDAVRAQFARLRELGVHVAVDDFGAGYSSIGSLLRFSADVLKIDRSYLEFDTTSGGSLVQAVSGLGRSLNLLVVAEGVETTEHLQRAATAGCHAAQGYLFARPADAEQITILLHGDSAGVRLRDTVAG
jgi:diguanylate cyclase (GGDEF)-like protein